MQAGQSYKSRPDLHLFWLLLTNSTVFEIHSTMYGQSEFQQTDTREYANNAVAGSRPALREAHFPYDHYFSSQGTDKLAEKVLVTPLTRSTCTSQAQKRAFKNAFPSR